MQMKYNSATNGRKNSLAYGCVWRENKLKVVLALGRAWQKQIYKWKRYIFILPL
jgi:hypothetical protein